MILWKYFLVFVLQLATFSFVSGIGYGDTPPKLIILTEKTQTTTIDFTMSHSPLEIRMDPNLISNYDCRFKLQITSGNCKENQTEAIMIRPNNALESYHFDCNNNNNSSVMAPLYRVYIEKNPLWNTSSKASFTLTATIYECPKFLMNWTFIITRSAVAIVFILIPTLVVYLLFYRRQVAIQRARMEREVIRRRNYNVAVIDMAEKHANDHPPNYDDVYDTKEPPPCFCEAVGLNMEIKSANGPMDLGQNQPVQGQGSSEVVVECPCKKL